MNAPTNAVPRLSIFDVDLVAASPMSTISSAISVIPFILPIAIFSLSDNFVSDKIERVVSLSSPSNALATSVILLLPFFPINDKTSPIVLNCV